MKNTWNELTTLKDWSDVLKQSEQQDTVILKHSTTCPVSTNALKEFENYINSDTDSDVAYFLVKVVESRPVSNQIAEDLSLKHESPQIIWVKNREKKWSATHWAATSAHMYAVLK